MKPPPLQYARADGGYVAFQTLGEGPLDVLLSATWLGSVELLWEHPVVSASLRRLASGRRLIVFDRLGIGASDPEAEGTDLSASWATSIEAVLDHLGSREAAGVGWNHAAAPMARVAGARPDLFQRLVLVNGALAGLGSMHGASTDETVDAGLWGDAPSLLRVIAPSAASDPGWVEWFDRAGRLGAAPRAAERFWRWLMEKEPERLVAPLPCRISLVQAGRISPATADGFPQLAAKFESLTELFDLEPVLVDSADLLAFTPEMPCYVDAIESLLEPDGVRNNRDRQLLTVCFTDVVGSTERAAALGDQRWRSLLDDHDRLVDLHVARNGGRVVKLTGDGHLSAFQSPTAAVECAHDLLVDLAAADLTSRAGVHLGEVELREDDLGGVAVHLAARVCGAAQPGEIWVTETVRGATLGGSVSYDAAGAHRLKGIDGTWSLHRVLAMS